MSKSWGDDACRPKSPKARWCSFSLFRTNHTFSCRGLHICLEYSPSLPAAPFPKGCPQSYFSQASLFLILFSYFKNFFSVSISSPERCGLAVLSNRGFHSGPTLSLTAQDVVPLAVISFYDFCRDVSLFHYCSYLPCWTDSLSSGLCLFQIADSYGLL